jgi:hypothetical protein
MNSTPRSEGVTASEKYLAGLCRSAFLSLWAHPNVFTNEGRRKGKGAGKELCDLLVVFGDQVILFSDKHCEYKESSNAEIDWKRWYRKAINKSVKQLVGAASFINLFPERLYLDETCQQKFPLSIKPGQCTFHLVAVTRGSRDACERYFGHQSLGSYCFAGDIEEGLRPFTVGPIHTTYGLVHVFDETTLDIIFNELDTVDDFIAYLRKRKELLSRKKPIIWTDGEEQLLATYLRNIRDDEHDFSIYTDLDGQEIYGVYINEGQWEELQSNPQYQAKKAADKVSYVWDKLLTRFIEDGDPALADVPPSLPRNNELEPAIREMASESRFARRVLGYALSEFVMSLESGKSTARLVPSPSTSSRVYVFLAEPYIPMLCTYEEYRQQRLAKVAAYAIVARTVVPTAKMTIGIALEGPYQGKRGGSEDMFCHYVPEITQDLLDEAARVQLELGILLPSNVRRETHKHLEYPDNSNNMPN